MTRLDALQVILPSRLWDSCAWPYEARARARQTPPLAQACLHFGCWLNASGIQACSYCRRACSSHPMHCHFSPVHSGCWRVIPPCGASQVATVLLATAATSPEAAAITAAPMRTPCSAQMRRRSSKMAGSSAPTRPLKCSSTIANVLTRAQASACGRGWQRPTCAKGASASFLDSHEFGQV